MQNQRSWFPKFYLDNSACDFWLILILLSRIIMPTSLIVGCYSYARTCRLVETLNFEHFPRFGHFDHGIICNTKQCIRFLSETVVSIAIACVYQLDYCGFNELIFKNFGGIVVEIKVFTLRPCIFWKYFLQNHFMFNDRHDTLSISNSRTFPSVNRFLMI